jgi:hypothetical protein
VTKIVIATYSLYIDLKRFGQPLLFHSLQALVARRRCTSVFLGAAVFKNGRAARQDLVNFSDGNIRERTAISHASNRSGPRAEHVNSISISHVPRSLSTGSP